MNKNYRSCKIDGCDREARAMDLCAAHYERLKKRQDMNRSFKKHTPKYVGCKVPSCERRHYSRGYCRAHYTRFMFSPNGLRPRKAIGKITYQSRTRTYNIWRGMKNRCKNPACVSFHRYGGRGIKVCDDWYDYENFLKDMGPAPDGLEIDRKDNDGDYCPENCHWTTPAVNKKNKQPFKLSDRQVKEIRKRIRDGEIQSALSREYGVSKALISRIKHKERRTIKGRDYEAIASCAAVG